MSRTAELGKLYQMLEGFTVAMMTTESPGGPMHSRPMMSQGSLPDADLVFVSSLETDKVKEIELNPRVNLAYYRESDRAWISIAGRATVSQDRARLQEVSKEAGKVWFSHGSDPADLCLIKVQVEEVTSWQPEHGKIASLLVMAEAYLMGEHPHLPPAQTMIVPAV
jgi:general stress protein 26